jgi:hypothetical protein
VGIPFPRTSMIRSLKMMNEWLFFSTTFINSEVIASFWRQRFGNFFIYFLVHVLLRHIGLNHLVIDLQDEAENNY